MRMSLGRGPACGDESSGLLCWPQHLEDVLCCRVWQALVPLLCRTDLLCFRA